MKTKFRNLPNWGAFVAAIGLVISASTFAISSFNNAGRSIRRLSTLGTALTETAQTVRDSTHPRDYAEALLNRKKDLDARFVDCGKPNLVVAEISENTRSVGASVLEIKPIDQPAVTNAQNKPNTVAYPRYQVALVGSYQQIAEFMKHCTRQRLPVRVVDFVLTMTDYRSEKNELMLRADVTVESYQEPKSAGEGQPS